MSERKRGRPKGSPATTNRGRELLFHTGTGRNPSSMDYGVFSPPNETKRDLRLTEDHLHIDCFSIIKVAQKQLLIAERSTLSEALDLFLLIRSEITPIESIYLTFKDSVIMSCGSNPSDMMVILSPHTIAKPL